MGPSQSGEWCYDFSFMKYKPTATNNKEIADKDNKNNNNNKDNGKCVLTADISCSTENGKDCEDIITTPDICGDKDVTLKYTYCNKNSRAINLSPKTSLKYNNVVEKFDSGF